MNSYVNPSGCLPKCPGRELAAHLLGKVWVLVVDKLVIFRPLYRSKCIHWIELSVLPRGEGMYCQCVGEQSNGLNVPWKVLSDISGLTGNTVRQVQADSYPSSKESFYDSFV